MKKQSLSTLQQLSFDVIPKEKLYTLKGGDEFDGPDQRSGECTCWFFFSDENED